ncbi:AraC-like DNA-binding protein [Panacagrimonas perspica]|uniref:AraC-like DNA-binding protein n=1 Tax=Panacagrimonas perspica TaxID=381431 RepID=A0A4R7PC46_9GAMM|nr:AraC family transcriptional regulator [Panacagrimonas perspica]TDU31675.1 AraC-like DNA-binding protein [Panacagrimonas perspica]THD03109.1 AraC family transcriptional regulator [Panacagrimonas perspica]
MTHDLLEAARRFADAHVDVDGVARTPFPGFVLFREAAPTPLNYCVNKPLVAMVLQGAKRVTVGGNTVDFGAGQSLLITAEVPTISQITLATSGAPYYSLVLELDLALVEALVVEMGTAPFVVGAPVKVESTETEVRDAAFRLLHLLDRPASVPMLQEQLMRELHFWLLAGRHGGAIRALGVTDSYARRVGRAVSLIRAEYVKPLPMERLAEAAGMSVSTFYTHFRAFTSLTPLQYQKQLRLIEARRSMLAEGTPIAHAAYGVGYESIPQFTREYARMFGNPPARDVREARTRTRRLNNASN